MVYHHLVRACLDYVSYVLQMEAKVIVARLVQTFQFTLPTDYKLVIAQRLTVQPKDNVPCTITLAN